MRTSWRRLWSVLPEQSWFKLGIKENSRIVAKSWLFTVYLTMSYNWRVYVALNDNRNRGNCNFRITWKDSAIPAYKMFCSHTGFEGKRRPRHNAYLFIYSRQQSPSWEANRFSPGQEIPYILWNPKVYCCVYKCSPPVPTLSQINPVHAPYPTYWRSILILSSHCRLGSSNWSLSLRFPKHNPACTSPLPIYATCPTYPILIDLITWAIFGEENKYLSSTLCSFLHSLSSLNVSDQVSHPYKTTGKIMVLYILIFIFLDSELEDKRFCTEW
jgi:hypothetical protein